MLHDSFASTFSHYLLHQTLLSIKHQQQTRTNLSVAGVATHTHAFTACQQARTKLIESSESSELPMGQATSLSPPHAEQETVVLLLQWY